VTGRHRAIVWGTYYAWRTAHFDKRTYRPWADLSDHESSAYDPLRTFARVARRASPEEAPIGAQHESTM
jgi:hypothetical protein